jgi:hypothetical protein
VSDLDLASEVVTTGARILSFPFRIGADGAAAVVLQESADGYAEQVGLLCLTVRGERPMAPSFGVTDPLFSIEGLSLAEIRRGVDAFGPPVSIVSLSARPIGDGTQSVEIELGDARSIVGEVRPSVVAESVLEEVPPAPVVNVVSEIAAWAPDGLIVWGPTPAYLLRWGGESTPNPNSGA